MSYHLRVFEYILRMLRTKIVETYNFVKVDLSYATCTGSFGFNGSEVYEALIS